MKLSSGLLTIVFTMGILSCANKSTEKNLETKVSQEPNVEGTSELRTTTAILIENSKFSPDKKTQLQSLHLKASAEMQAYREELLKLRSILIKDVFSNNYNKSEVALIQKKIRNLEDKRLALMFKTIDTANGILGRENRAQEELRLMDRMIGEHSEY